jgi:hypothetical protein
MVVPRRTAAAAHAARPDARQILLTIEAPQWVQIVPASGAVRFMELDGGGKCSTFYGWVCFFAIDLSVARLNTSRLRFRPTGLAGGAA